MKHNRLKRTPTTLLMILTGFLFTACNTLTVQGTGRSYEINHTVTEIREVELHGIGELTLQNGQENQLVVLAQEEIHDHLSIRQEDDQLIIGPREGYQFRTNEPPRFLLNANHLDTVIIRGAIDLTSGNYRTEQLAIEASGSSDVDLTLHASNLTIDASGSFDGYLSGEVNTLKVDFSGSSDLNADDLKAKDVDIDISGAGTAYIHATETLTISAAGAVKVVYSGNPVVSQSAAGATSISHSD
ncbi:head GIN domain-containing protein [Reinekea sp. G2M2-21]|uniref:head GIN domain-containing protein n=1 Tax=Reinekea sp. G2M2-21 TaxID=2788942 RepID=UPI0018A97327